MSALHEVERIASHRTIDVIEAPIWDCQAAAFLIHGRWPVVVSLQTTFAIWLESHPEMTANASWMREYAMPIMDLERWILQKAHAIRSISRAIMLDIEAKYGFIFDKNKIVISPLGLWSSSAQSDADSCKNDGAAEILFVGRLEARKGIDVLLAAIPKVLEHHPNTRFRIVGDNSIPIPGEEKTYKEEFFTKYSDLVADGIVVFEGKISDEELLNAYHRCDVFVSPSRYESFGLIFLEAMRESKPVIGCSVGGMPEIIIHQETGFLVPPGDQFELATAISLLASNRNLCNEMGKKGLALFNRKFTAMQMAKGSMPIYEKASCFYSRL
jgi:glycosyltransferase involved in cell wall biosynthesis